MFKLLTAIAVLLAAPPTQARPRDNGDGLYLTVRVAVQPRDEQGRPLE